MCNRVSWNSYPFLDARKCKEGSEIHTHMKTFRKALHAVVHEPWSMNTSSSKKCPCGCNGRLLRRTCTAFGIVAAFRFYSIIFCTCLISISFLVVSLQYFQRKLQNNEVQTPPLSTCIVLVHSAFWPQLYTIFTLVFRVFSQPSISFGCNYCHIWQCCTSGRRLMRMLGWTDSGKNAWAQRLWSSASTESFYIYQPRFLLQIMRYILLHFTKALVLYGYVSLTVCNGAQHQIRRRHCVK